MYVLMQNCFVFAHTSANSCNPYNVAKCEAYTSTAFSQNCNIGHGLGTCKGQTNGMLISPIFSIHKMAAQAQLDVIWKVTNS